MFRIGLGAVPTAHFVDKLLLPTAPTLVSSGDEIVLPLSGTWTRDSTNQLDAYRVARRNRRQISVQAQLKASGIAGGPCWKPGDPAKINPRGTYLSCAGWPNPSPYIHNALPLIAYPLGTAIFLDVPFNVAEYIQAADAYKASGTFAMTRNYAPDPEQAIVMGKAIMDASLSVTPWNDAARNYWPSVGVKLNQTPSINQEIALGRLLYGVDLTQAVAGYGMNPIVPTFDELNQPGGWAKYHDRGGFLLDRNIVLGTSPVAKQPFVYLGQYCTCSGTPFGAIYQAGGGSKDVFIKALGAQWTMTLKPSDRGVFQAIVGSVVSVMTGFGKLLCAAAPIITSVDKSILAAEVCTDSKTKKTCTKTKTDSKGKVTPTPNCVCTKPSMSQEMGVALANAALNYWCAHAQGLINPQDTPPFDPNAQAPIIAPPAEMPWWVLPAGAAFVGFLVLRK